MLDSRKIRYKIWHMHALEHELTNMFTHTQALKESDMYMYIVHVHICKHVYKTYYSNSFIHVYVM